MWSVKHIYDHIHRVIGIPIVFDYHHHRFCTGGQSEEEAAKNLNSINKLNDSNFLMTFSYGRALQQSALKYWAKNQEDINGTQKIFNHRSKMNGLSTYAKWDMDLENQITI